MHEHRLDVETLACLSSRSLVSALVELNEKADLLAVNTDPGGTNHATRQHSRKQTTGAAMSKDASIPGTTDQAEHLPETTSRDVQRRSGQVSAEATAGTINQLAFKRTASDSHMLRKNTTSLESSPQSLGKRKRGTGQLVRPSQVLSGKSTNRRSKLMSTSDTYAINNISPGKTKRVPKSGTIHHGKTGLRSSKKAVRSSSPAPIVGGAAEQESPVAIDGIVDHLSDLYLGSLNRRVGTRMSPKPSGRPRKQPEQTRPSASNSESTNSRNYNLRNTGRGVADKSKTGSKTLENDPKTKSSPPTAKGAMPSPKSSKTFGKSASIPHRAKQIRKDGALVTEPPYGDDSDSLAGDGAGGEGEHLTRGIRGVRFGSDHSTVQFRSHDDDDSLEGHNMDEHGEEIGVEIEEDNDCADQTELNEQHQLENTGGFLLRGHDWAKVMEGANTVGVSNKDNVVKKGKPHLETRTMKDFVRQVRKISKFYKVSGRRGEVEPEAQILARQVESIDEDQAGNKKCEIIQDIYAHAIPELVFMLDEALAARETECSLPNHIKGLAEIIQLQDIVIHLCEKARGWKGDPVTDRLIKKPTTQKILPYMRSMRKSLHRELENRKREFQRKKDGAGAELERHRMEEEMRRKKIEDERVRLKIWERIDEQLDRNERVLFSRKPLRLPRLVLPLGTDDWTFEQELVLNKYLEEFGDLPGEFWYRQYAMMFLWANRPLSS